MRVLPGAGACLLNDRLLWFKSHTDCHRFLKLVFLELKLDRNRCNALIRFRPGTVELHCIHNSKEKKKEKRKIKRRINILSFHFIFRDGLGLGMNVT